jgi:dolichol-phosphate mannosyltransferase
LKLSIVIPSYNEASSITETVTTLFQKLVQEEIEHEILVINDNSTDDTLEVLKALTITIDTLKVFTNNGPNGFGYAVRYGLENFQGDYVAIMMADLSDSPDDLIKFYYKILEGYDCVFGNRWVRGSKVVDYPRMKRVINFMANFIVQKTFRLKYNDCTNAFKLYSRETIEGLRPFLAPHFNLTLELPLKAIVRGYSYAVLPNSWTNRKYGESKLKIKEMGSRYFFILLYCLIEKYFSKGDFKKNKRIESSKIREKQLNL